MVTTLDINKPVGKSNKLVQEHLRMQLPASASSGGMFWRMVSRSVKDKLRLLAD